MNRSQTLNTLRVSLRPAGVCTGLIVACIGLLLSSATPAWPQATSSSSITGQVMDQSNAAVAGAEVVILENSTNSRRTTTTNELGRYVFMDVSPGVYEVIVSHPGFSSERVGK